MEPALDVEAPIARSPSGPRQRVSTRLPELDALRGVMLIGMTLTHLPTHASYYFYQPLGFLGWAEGFILVSAILTGRIYGKRARSGTAPHVRRRLWLRAATLYKHHVVLLAVAFTAVAAVAVRTNEPALQGLLDFYLAHRMLAVVSSALLLYCPPLLDILPMYILFLFLTPSILYVARRWGWRFVLAAAGLLWIAAQFGLREFVYARMVHLTGLQIPIQNMGAFNVYAWQFLWVAGLWAGADETHTLTKRIQSRGVMVTALVVVSAFVILRYRLFGFGSHPLDEGNGWFLFDKWQIGGMRLLNLAALASLFASTRRYIAKYLAIPPLVLLGKSSLDVFSLHVLFCFGALSLVGDGATAPWSYQLSILVACFSGLYALAYRKSKRKQKVVLERWPTTQIQSIRDAA